MTVGPINLVYFDEWMAARGPELAARIPGVSLTRLSSDDPAEVNWQGLAKAHGHQLRPSTETPKEFYPGEDFLARCPNLLAIASAGAGYDMVDVDACTRAGVLLFNQTGANSESVAQHVLAMMLTLSKQLIQTDRAIRREARDWTRWDYTGRELTQKTVGIVGLGNIGRRVAEICRTLFAMRVVAYDPYISDADFHVRGAERRHDLETLFREADFISINCPLTDETRGMIGAELYAVMKPTAYFVTTARGGIHDEAALEKVIREARIAGAGLDVFVEEPPAWDHPLLAYDNVIVSPHNAGVTEDCNDNMVVSATEQWTEVFAGRRPRNIVNPEVWDKFQERYSAAFGLNAAE